MNPVAIIFDNFGPYHVARLEAAAQVCDLHAIEVAGASGTYAWERPAAAGGFSRTTLLADGTSDGLSPRAVAAKVEAALEAISPAVVFVPGWASPAAWGALRWCGRRRVPAIGMSESTAWDEQRVSWKEAIKRRLLRQFAAALVGGTLHREYLVQLGLPAERIFFGYDAVDHDYFVREADAIRADPDAVRLKYGLPENYFLASARFVAKKNLPRLLEAYALYRTLAAGTPWALVLLGDGELRGELERQRDALGLTDAVLLPGFRQYGELPAFYALADAFVLPSTVEPWGLVVNEAAASGLPLLVSQRCGCAAELVRENHNGFTFDPYDVAQMAEKLRHGASFGFPRAAFGAASREIAAQWGPERFAQGVQQAVRAALASGPASFGWVDRALLSLMLRR